MSTILHEMIKSSRRLRAPVKKAYTADVDRWIKFAGADQKKWTRYKAQEFYDHLLDDEEMLPQTANRVMMGIRYAASWWAKMEGKPELDFTQIQMARGRSKKPRHALTEEEATQLIESIRKDTEEPRRLRDLALFVVGLETGMRRSSLAGMMIETTLARPTLPDGSNHPTTSVPLKGRDEPYDVVLSDTAIRALAPWLAFLKKQRITTGSVFRSLYHRVEKKEQIGASLTDRSIYNIVAERATEAKIGRTIHPHLFRHTFVTWRLQAKVPPYLISIITGHKLRGIDEEMGAMFGYMDKAKLYDMARETTPDWLAKLIAGSQWP